MVSSSNPESVEQAVLTDGKPTPPTAVKPWLVDVGVEGLWLILPSSTSHFSAISMPAKLQIMSSYHALQR